MLKRLIILFLFLPVITFAQFTDDFEDADITDWTQSTADRWAASDISPLNGSYSLHHIDDNDGDNDQVSFSLSSFDLTAQNTAWRFKIKYNYNPSGGNNWNVFIASDADASEMYPTGSINGYVIGVNFSEDDDTLRLYKISSGNDTEIIVTSLNIDDDTNPSDVIAIEVWRSTTGDWEVKYNVDGNFDNLISIGTGTDNTYTIADYFGIYYLYTSSADRLLWIDDIYVGPEIVDDIPPIADSLYIISSQNLKVEFNEKIDSAIAVNPLNYTVDGGIGNPDSVVVDATYRNAELFFTQKLTDSQLYSMDIISVEDLSGNAIKDTIVNFTYEYIKPISVEVISVNEIQVQFSRLVDTLSAEDVANYSLNNGIGNSILAQVLAGDSSKVQLQFGSDFINETYYDLTIQDVADQNLDSLQTEIISFLYFIPEPFDVVINEIMADPNPEVNLPNYEYLEIFNTTEFDIDLAGWKLKAGTSVKDFPDYILDSASYVTLCSAIAGEYLEIFGSVLEFSSFPLITNSGTTISIFDENDNFIDSVRFTDDWYNDSYKETGGWSLERIDPLNTCSGSTNWKASIDENGGTPGTENSVYASNIDSEAPGIENVVIVSSNQLKIILSEPVTELTLLEKANYNVNNGIGNPLSIVASNDLLEVDILFSSTFPEKTNLTLSIENLSDECGNLMSLTEIDFVYYVVQPNDIVINEIMADPEPLISLPEFEYIEIYNTSDYNIDLLNWTLTVGSTIKTLSTATITPGNYLIICSSDAALELQSFGNVFVVSGFPALTNSGQTIILRNSFGEIITSISYSEDWYQDDYKAEGGWSLEQIDPLNPCGGENNWTASNSITGGTPGQENSVYASNPDVDAPELLRVGLIDEQHIQLFFNETIDSLSALQTINYNVDQGIGNPILVDLIGVDYKSVILEFNKVFDSNTIYTLEISGGIFDCAGNEISSKNTAQFSIPSLPNENDLVINEVLFNPLPDGFDFVEIYNRSDITIDLQEVLIAAYKDDELEYSSINEITSEAYLIFPGDYVVLTEDPEVVQKQYISENPDGFIKCKDLPSYNDDNGRVMLLDKWQNLIDNFGYDDDMQFALLATDEGVSLERINYNRPSDDKTNWHSASQLVGFATPAYENSQFTELEDIEDEVNIEPETFSPDNDGFEDVTNISFTFDEPGYVANIKIYDSKGRLIRYLANNLLLGIEGVITWDGLDEENQKAPVGIYVIYIEIFDLDGNVKQYKKAVVLAAMW
jgi:hypothetical protein